MVFFFLVILKQHNPESHYRNIRGVYYIECKEVMEVVIQVDSFLVVEEIDF